MRTISARTTHIVGRWLPAALAPILAALLLFPPAAAAGWLDGRPPEGRIDYAISRGGSPVGAQSVEFVHNGNGLLVRTRTEIAVTFLSMTIYRFEHDAAETWENGRLSSFVSRTDDDGKDRAVELAAEGDRLVGLYNGKSADVPGDIIPASLWHPRTVESTLLMDPIKGRARAVQVADLGEDEIVVNGAAVAARHYAITGEIEREVWYDPEGKLVQVSFKAKDGSTIMLQAK